MKLHTLAFLTFLLFGCATVPEFRVDIDSISAPDASNKMKYILYPGVKDVTKSDLQFQEYSSYVERALNSKGYHKAENIHKANVAIFVSYGIGDPQTRQYSYTTPTYGQTGVSSSQTYGTANTYGSTTSYSGTTTYTPTYGITGYSTHTGTHVVYFRHMSLEAFDLDEYKKTKVEKPLWKTSVTSTGSSGDLRQVFPILVAAAKDYISSNTGKKLSVSLKETDPEVLAIKGIKEP